jgi:U3 small nucleolar RNA-associated protein 21
MGLWVFKRGQRVAELEMPIDLEEPVRRLAIFGSWIVGGCSTRIEVWKSTSYEHYMTITPMISRNMPGEGSLSGPVCSMPTFLNKILVGKQDGSVEIWNLSSGSVHMP